VRGFWEESRPELVRKRSGSCLGAFGLVPRPGVFRKAPWPTGGIWSSLRDSSWNWSRGFRAFLSFAGVFASGPVPGIPLSMPNELRKFSMTAIPVTVTNTGELSTVNPYNNLPGQINALCLSRRTVLPTANQIPRVINGYTQSRVGFWNFAGKFQCQLWTGFPRWLTIWLSTDVGFRCFKWLSRNYAQPPSQRNHRR